MLVAEDGLVVHEHGGEEHRADPMGPAHRGDDIVRIGEAHRVVLDRIEIARLLELDLVRLDEELNVHGDAAGFEDLAQLPGRERHGHDLDAGRARKRLEDRLVLRRLEAAAGGAHEQLLGRAARDPGRAGA